MDHEANTNQTNIPDNAFRTGDLSGDPGHIRSTIPATGLQDGSGQGRTPFPGNIIPSNRINPIAAKILSHLPPTNENFDPLSQTNDYFALLPATKTTDQVDSKIDWALTDKDRLSGRFSFQRPVIFQAPEFRHRRWALRRARLKQTAHRRPIVRDSTTTVLSAQRF